MGFRYFAGYFFFFFFGILFISSLFFCSSNDVGGIGGAIFYLLFIFERYKNILQSMDFEKLRSWVSCFGLKKLNGSFVKFIIL